MPTSSHSALRWLVAASALSLFGCSVGPTYQRPELALPSQFKEAPATDSTWLPAVPADTLQRGPWWQLFGDPALSALVEQVDVSNQNVASAVAAYAQAQALVRQQRAALFPALSANASATRSGGSAAQGRATDLQLGLGASWEPDVWGQLELGVQSARAGAQASAANLAAARLSAQAALATNYFALREADNEIALLGSTLQAYERSLSITKNQYAASIAQRTDVLQAQTQFETTQANLVSLRAQRAVLEHAIALLVGKAPADFSLPAAPWNTKVPSVPLAVPSELLQRRPDIASAERAVVQANAQVGIQRAAYFPSVTLTGSYGSAASNVPDLFRAANSLWSLGLAAAQVLFDAGAVDARVDAAKAARDQAVANYRQTVLSAFQVVEDQLATSRSLAEQDALRRAASADADLTEQLTLNQYLQGQVSYTTVVTAQVTALSARQTLSQLMSSRQASAIALIQSMGGGWQDAGWAAAPKP